MHAITHWLQTLQLFNHLVFPSTLSRKLSLGYCIIYKLHACNPSSRTRDLSECNSPFPDIDLCQHWKQMNIVPRFVGVLIATWSKYFVFSLFAGKLSDSNQEVAKISRDLNHFTLEVVFLCTSQSRMRQWLERETLEWTYTLNE